MLHINEFRVGNYLKTDKDVFLTIKNMLAETEAHILVFNEGGGCYTCSLQQDVVYPILLTPEILENCGYRYLAWEDFIEFTHFVKDDFILRQAEDGYSFFNTSACNPNERQYITSIKYLHELQNIIFVLTGREIEVTL